MPCLLTWYQSKFGILLEGFFRCIFSRKSNFLTIILFLSFSCSFSCFFFFLSDSISFFESLIRFHLLDSFLINFRFAFSELYFLFSNRFDLDNIVFPQILGLTIKIRFRFIFLILHSDSFSLSLFSIGVVLVIDLSHNHFVCDSFVSVFHLR
jgi:hypothetical protein